MNSLDAGPGGSIRSIASSIRCFRKPSVFSPAGITTNALRVAIAGHRTPKVDASLRLQFLSQFLRRDEERVPHRREWRRVGQVELFEIFYPETALERGGDYVNAAGGALLAD